MKFRDLSHFLDELFRKIHFILGIRNIFYAKWWGVYLGKNAKFDGKCYFNRYPGSVIKIGENSIFRSRKRSNLIGIDRPCTFSTLIPDAIIEIGDNCGFSGTVIGGFKHIKIGNNLRCGANTLITDADWHIDDPRSGSPSEVIIEDNVWLGINSVVLKGVTIGENSIIGANSVVTKNIPANVIAAGNPCKIIKQIK